MIQEITKTNSENIQQVIDKRPNIFIMWGSFFVIVILSVLFILFDKIKIDKSIRLPIVINNIENNSYQKDSLIIILSSNINIKQIEPNQQGVILLPTDSNSVSDSLMGKIYSVSFSRFNTPIIRFGLSSKKGRVNLSSGMIGTLDVIIKRQSFLSIFFQKLKL